MDFANPWRRSPIIRSEPCSQGPGCKDGKAGLSPKTINTYSQVVKSVVASAVNEEGEQL